MTARMSTDVSKTQKIYLLMQNRIEAGIWQSGARLPSEPALSDEFAVSRVTVRRALARLAADGLIDRRPGSGTFVSAQERRVRALIGDVANVFTGLIEMGRATNVRLLSFDYVRAPEPVREALGLEAGELVQRSVRVRLVDEVPFSHLTAHVPARIGAIYSEADLARVPLLELMERSGLKVASARQDISAELAGPDVSEPLDVDVGAPLVSLTRTVFGPNGEGMEHLHALYHPGRYALQMELVRSDNAGPKHWSVSGTNGAGPSPATDTAEAEDT
ncbi:MAG: GntR family transcriptional regulator [Pseudomonadota bacterium]